MSTQDHYCWAYLKPSPTRNMQTKANMQMVVNGMLDCQAGSRMVQKVSHSGGFLTGFVSEPWLYVGQLATQMKAC